MSFDKHRKTAEANKKLTLNSKLDGALEMILK